MDRPIDQLTGLTSGVELNSQMESLLNAGGVFSLILVDIDHLSALNGGFGHEAGDEVFKLAAKHIKEVFSAPCEAFRDTRDEFTILLPGIGKEKAFLMAETLRKAVFEAKLDFKSADGKPLTQSVSIGVSSYPDDGSRPADILRKADGAMVRAKKDGRNMVCLAREEKLIPKTSHYTQAQLGKLSELSDKTGVGESSLMREALDDLLRKYDE